MAYDLPPVGFYLTILGVLFVVVNGMAMSISAYIMFGGAFLAFILNMRIQASSPSDDWPGMGL